MKNVLEDLEELEGGLDRLIHEYGNIFAANIPTAERHVLVRAAAMRLLAELVLLELPTNSSNIESATHAVRLSHVLIINKYANNYSELGENFDKFVSV